MLDIGLRPTAFQQMKRCKLTADLPALAIDTLVGLYEEFIDLLARIFPAMQWTASCPRTVLSKV